MANINDRLLNAMRKASDRPQLQPKQNIGNRLANAMQSASAVDAIREKEAARPLPSVGERIGLNLKGTGERRLSGHLGTAENLARAAQPDLKKFNDLASGNLQKQKHEQENAAHYRDILAKGYKPDGTRLTSTDRAMFAQLAQRAERNAKSAQAMMDADAVGGLGVIKDLDRYGNQMAEKAQADTVRGREGLGKVWGTVYDVGSAGADLLADAAENAIIPGAGTASRVSRMYGQGSEKAQDAGGNLLQQTLAGGATAAIGEATNRLLSSNPLLKKAYGKGALDDILFPNAGKTVPGAMLKSAFGEGLEEGAEDILDEVAENIIYDHENKDKLTAKEVGYDALVGAILGGLTGASNVKRFRPQETITEPTQTAQGSVSPSAPTTDTPKANVRPTAVNEDSSVVAENATTTPTGAENATVRESRTVSNEERVAQAQARVDAAKERGASRAEQRIYDADLQNAKAEKAARPSVDPLIAALTKGKRVDNSTLTNEQFDALADRSDLDVDAEQHIYQVKPEQHIDNRGKGEIADRRVKAFQYDHPGVQKYYRPAAEQLLVELTNYVPGGRTETATGEYGQTYSWRTKRNASPRIAALLDGGMKRDEIEAALDAIIKDKGAENYANAKRIEMVIDDMLTNGYSDGTQFIPSNADYIAEKGQIPGNKVDEIGHGLDDIDPSDGLGAADAGSLNSDYDNLQAQSDEFYPEGANAARPVDVPTKDFDGNPISKSASTVMGAKAVPDEVVPMIEQMVADGKMSYTTRSDKKSLENAEAIIRHDGFDGALARFREAVNAGKSGKDVVTLGQVLMNNVLNEENSGEAVAEILSLYKSLSVNAGQAMQAFSIFRKLSPENQLYGVQRSVDSLNERLSSKLGKDVEIDPDLLTKFMEQADQDGRDAVMEEIYQNIADQVPSTWMDKWNAWRYLAMLGNPRTHIRNILGNIGFQPIRYAKDKIAAGLEAGLQKAGVKVERTKSFRSDPELYKAAFADYDNAREVLAGSKYDDVSTEISKRKTVFKNKALETLRKKNGAALEAEDAVFKRITYASALSKFLKANGVNAEQLSNGQISSGLLDRARTYAANEALKATYQDDNAVSKSVTKIVKAMGPVGEAVMPFKKTPANILARGLDYSPAGLIKSLTYDLHKVAKGEMQLNEALDSMASGLTGSALFALGGHLLAAGLLTASPEGDEDDKWAQLLGHQGYALELPNGVSVTLDWLAPESLPFFMGAELASAMGENGFQAADIATALKSVANPMMDLSMLQGVNDLIESATYAKDKPLQAMIPSVITSYFSQAIPTLFGQIERSTEPYRMTTFTEEGKNLSKDAQYAIGRASSRIPGFDYQQIPFIDAWGRKEPNGDALTRTLSNALNPSYVSQVDVDAVEKEIQKVRDATGSTSVFPKRADKKFTVDGKDVVLDATKYQRYAESKGKISYDMLKSGMKTAAYQRMDSEEKADFIDKCYDYANQVAKSKVSSYKPAKWVTSAQEAERKCHLDPAVVVAYRNKLSSARDGGMKGSEANEYIRSAIRADKTLNTAQKNALDDIVVSDITVIPKDKKVDYASDESFIITQMSDSAQKRYPGIKSKFGMSAEDFKTAWAIYNQDGVSADSKRNQISRMGYNGPAVYKAFGKRYK